MLTDMSTYCSCPMRVQSKILILMSDIIFHAHMAKKLFHGSEKKKEMPQQSILSRKRSESPTSLDGMEGSSSEGDSEGEEFQSQSLVNKHYFTM